jgi:hypothetical protein
MFLVAPSVNSLFVTGILMLVMLVLIITNYKQFMRFDFYRKLNIISLIAIAIGVHGLIHLGVESVYGINPFKLFFF